jgi:hypothetical protein
MTLMTGDWLLARCIQQRRDNGLISRWRGQAVGSPRAQREGLGLPVDDQF